MSMVRSDLREFWLEAERVITFRGYRRDNEWNTLEPLYAGDSAIQVCTFGNSFNASRDNIHALAREA
jgi:hypothetical protein